MHEAWFFIGFFVFIFIVWIALGGPTKNVSLHTPTYSASSSTTTSTSLFGTNYLSLPRAPFSISAGDSSLSGSGTGGYAASTEPLVKVPGVIFPAVSRYRGDVSMSSYVSNASSTDASTEYVQLYLSSSASASVDITGWRLKSGASGKSAAIPRGTAVPTSGIVNATSDIWLKPGESAIIISGESPVGASFRENECIGYFESFQDFTPSLPRDCPDASDELSSLYGKLYIQDPNCIDYVDTLSRCQVPTSRGLKKLSLTCQDFIETYLDYNGCRIAHQSDTDFNGTVWHIWLGRDDDRPLWRSRHEVVELLDRAGYVVDAFTY